ncbi:hypothetical protein AC1031_018910 [Aphanomyces cochlioides]|nr:hypothetical protein AC1031_018910 [Aphanomyces cochlioides]
MKLLEKHEEFTATSSRSNGIAEDECESVMLLDELSALFQAHKKRQDTEKAAAAENLARQQDLKLIRETPTFSKKKEIDSFLPAMKDDMNSHLDFEKFKFDKEIELKQQERQDRVAERKDRIEMLRLKHAIMQAKLQLDKRSLDL